MTRGIVYVNIVDFSTEAAVLVFGEFGVVTVEISAVRPQFISGWWM